MPITVGKNTNKKVKLEKSMTVSFHEKRRDKTRLILFRDYSSVMGSPRGISSPGIAAGISSSATGSPKGMSS